MDLKEKIKGLSSDLFEETRKIRRHMHMYPELSFQESNTSLFIQERLKQYNIPFQSNIADNGVVAIIEGRNPKSKVKALRADFDALPIEEENDVPYKSKNVGVMHACGHDVHTASLLGAARILQEVKNEFQGTVKLIFQPAEEKLPGGASLMIKEGVLENPNVNHIFGQHVHPPLPTGKVGFRPGIYMASADELFLTVKGKGGHAASPHEGIDPLVMTSHIILGLQQIVSRRANPVIPCVISFGKINSDGGATNVIPDEIHLQGTFRTLDEEWRYKAHELMKDMIEHQAKAYGGSAEFDIKVGYPFLKNDHQLTAIARESAIQYLGSDNVVDLPIRMTAEDFSYFSHEIPACFYRLGTGNKEKGIDSAIHTSTFDVDENSLKIGMGLFAYLITQS